MINFIGRDRELEQIYQFCNSEKGKLLLVAGESGIGKTTLIKEFANKASETHWAFCFSTEPGETENNYLYQWLIDIQTGDGFFKGQYAWKRIVEKEPKIIDFVRLSLATVRLAMKIRFLELLKRLSSLRSNKETLIIIIDPVRNLDDRGVLDTIGFMVDKIPSRVKIILTWRHDSICHTDGWLAAKGDISTLFLSRFSEDESRRMLYESGLLDKIEETLIQKVIARSQGNPLYLEGAIGLLRRGIKDQGKIISAVDNLPHSLHGLGVELYKNIRSVEEREIIHWLSIVSDHVDYGMVSFLTQFSPDKVADLLEESDSLLEVMAAGRSPSGGDLGLLHEVFADVVLEELAKDKSNLAERYKRLSAFYLNKVVNNKDDFNALRLYHLYLYLSDDKDAYIKAASGLIERFYAFGLRDSCIEIIERVIRYNEALRRARQEYVELISKCGIICHEQGYSNKAVELFNHSLAIHKEINNREGEASDLGNIGIAYRDIFETDKAIESLKESSKIYKAIDNKVGEIHILRHIWMIYYTMIDFERAIEYLLKLMAVTKELGLTEKIPSILGNIGKLYLEMGDFDNAVIYYEQGVDICRKLGNRQKEALFLSRIGIAYLSNGLKIEAIEYFSNSLKFHLEIGNMHGVATQYGNIGIAYKNLQDFDNALVNLERALKLFVEGGAKKHISLMERTIMSVKKMQEEREE